MRHLSPNGLNRAVAHALRRSTSLTIDSLVFGALATLGLLTSTDALAEATEPPAFTVEIRNITETSGALYVQVLSGEAAYKNSNPAAAQLILPAKEGSLVFSFDSLPAGEYAVRVMQDHDGDGQLKTNMVGMPQEPWGVSNDAKGRFGPPQWEQVKIAFPEQAGQTHVITLR